jgi:hypothetical protein
MRATFQGSQMRRRIVSIRYCNAMCDATVQYSDTGTLVKLEEYLPFFPESPQDLLRREVEVDLRRGESIMGQEPLQGWPRDAFLDRRDGEGGAQHVGGHRPTDMGLAEDPGDRTSHVPYTTYGLANTLRASSSRLRLVSCA